MSPVIRPRPIKARSQRPTRAPKLRIELYRAEVQLIDKLVDIGLHGETREQVVLTLVRRGLQDLVADNVWFRR
jgi:hypothetical protein